MAMQPNDLADTGILFPADPVETLSLPDHAGILFLAVPAGIPIPPDPAVILFPASLAEPVTMGVADLADAGILFPAVPAGIPIPADPAGILFPADLVELDTVGVVDVVFVGEASLVVFDVFDGPELVAMIVAGEVETVEGIPVDYGDDSDDSEYKDTRNEFKTINKMPVYYGGDFNDSDCEDPRDLAYKDWVDWRDFNSPDGYCGFFPDDWEAQLPVTDCASVMVVGETAAPIRLQQDSWDASVSVADIDPGRQWTF